MFSFSKKIELSTEGLKHVKPPALEFDVDVTFDPKIDKAVSADPLMIQMMTEACQKVRDQTEASINGKLKAFDKLIQTMLDKGAEQSDLNAQLAGLNKSIEQDKAVGVAAAKQAVEATWKNYQTKKKEYIKYGVKIGASIGGAVAGLTVSIATIASGGFTGGASAVIGVIGMIKSCVTIAKEIANLAMSVEQATKLMDKELAAVEALAKKHKALLKANEYAATIANQFLGASQPSIKVVKDQFDIVSKKLDGIEIQIHSASTELNKVLIAQEKSLDQFMDKAKELLSKYPGARGKEDMSKIQAKLDAVMLKSRSCVMECIGDVHTIRERWQKASEAVEKSRPRVESLVKIRGTDVKIFENVLVFVDIPLAAINGNGIATKATDLASGLGTAGASFAYDKIKSGALDGTLLA